MDPIITQLQTFAEDLGLNLNVSYAFAALDTDTSYHVIGRNEHDAQATPAEIAWASANVRPLTCETIPDISDDLREKRWRNTARALRVFTRDYVRRRSGIENGTNCQLLKRALEQGLIVQIRPLKKGRRGWPALYEWVDEPDNG